MRRFLIAMSLVCVVCATTSAGEIPSVGIAPPPPPPSDNVQGTNTTSGEIPTGGSSYEITATTVELIQMFLGVGV